MSSASVARTGSQMGANEEAEELMGETTSKPDEDKLARLQQQPQSQINIGPALAAASATTTLNDGRHKSSISSSSSSMFTTNSTTSASSSLTSILTNSPISTTDISTKSQSMSSAASISMFGTAATNAANSIEAQLLNEQIPISTDDVSASSAAQQPQQLVDIVQHQLGAANEHLEASGIPLDQRQMLLLETRFAHELAAPAATSTTSVDLLDGGAALQQQQAPGPDTVELLAGIRSEPQDLCQENRLERSNSCSQAECGLKLASNCITISSLSHDNLAKSIDDAVVTTVSSDDLDHQVDCSSVGQLPIGAEIISGSPPVVSSSYFDNSVRPIATEAAIVTTATTTGQSTPQKSSTASSDNKKPSQVQQASQSSGSLRFFSSKLNTGSLWSLLSVGSSSSSIINEMPASDNLASNDANAANPNGQMEAQDDKQQTNQIRQQDLVKSNTTSSFLSRYQFKRQQQSAGSTGLDQHQSREQTPLSSQSTVAQSDKKRYRFSIKYIGSALLHKNFTLPMLEWIAKDVKRQTIRGAQSTSQRQFTIPTRDIVFEIQSNQLTAISCKDGHCIFVHPMHCVSKYVQLQYDPTCFAYIIRDAKEAPSFCHVFQAKSANKVHDIFSAIREATTRTQLQSVTPATSGVAPGGAGSMLDSNSQLFGLSNRLQKSASTDGHWKSLLGASPCPMERGHGSSMPTTPPLAQAHRNQASNPVSSNVQQQQQQQAGAGAGTQFENSYQFEVMFVKRVKLQCRRVPPTFVDDALETLKSFEVLKGGHGVDSKASQIKGVGKRIISASVDERQEYDETCQSPTPATPSASSSRAALLGDGGGCQSAADGNIEPADERRGSSVSLDQRPTEPSNGDKEERESKSCQQSPTKLSKCQPTEIVDGTDDNQVGILHQNGSGGLRPVSVEIKKHHQSMDCLKSIDCTIRSAKQGQAPAYTNDFSPYNTITSSDLNERIAAIPVVSSSVSLDHETRQKLARQVRETIMATAANIKKDVFASGDKLDSSASSKALDSLSCNVVSSVPAVDQASDSSAAASERSISQDLEQQVVADHLDSLDHRRSSAGAGGSILQRNQQQQQQSASNNFDLFRRASARQVVKNRTMLLLIGKDELCAISIDKHQILFSKSFNSIVHCLQGNSNKDHFGLICRDSGKINPQAESYAGFVFKCQSEKVVREIMGALKQVIYSSQHNSYHGYNSPYNPLNSVASCQQYTKAQQSSNLDRHQFDSSPASITSNNSIQQQQTAIASSQQQSSLVAKRGFANPLELDDGLLARQSKSSSLLAMTPTCAVQPPPPPTASIVNHQIQQQTKNPIRSMFCDNCPLYWYHRLCCDVESLPAEASKAIILRRIDSSLSEKEQDEVYSRFSEFNIESVDEHNEIFMSILRHQCERKQLKHSQSQAHLSAIAKNLSFARQQSSTALDSRDTTHRECSGSHQKQQSPHAARYSHQRSGSTSGSLAYVISQTNAANQAAGQSIADASLVAIDNLKRAKNSISVSIENMLKRRSSMKDEQEQDDASSENNCSLPIRSGSFKSTSRESHAAEQVGKNSKMPMDSSSLKRSQSTSDYSQGAGASNNFRMPASWRNSLTRTINESDLTNPLVGLFRRRGSMAKSEQTDAHDDNHDTTHRPIKASNESLSIQSEHRQAANLQLAANQSAGGLSPSSVLSGVFWKKSIFDKIRQPIVSLDDKSAPICHQQQLSSHSVPGDGSNVAANANLNEKTATNGRRTREELRSLWKKAILEQITLLKMDKQNQKLQANAVECNIQRIKLNYRDALYGRDALILWDRLLKQDPTKKVDFIEVARMVRLGVPKQRRGEVWMFLMNQYQLRHGVSFQPADSEFHGDANQAYRSLLSQLSTQQHEIFVDIGK